MRTLLRAESVQVFKSFKMLWKTRSNQGKSEGEEGKAGPALAPWFFKAPELPSSSPNFADLTPRPQYLDSLVRPKSGQMTR
jgi:hypothetical protein